MEKWLIGPSAEEPVFASTNAERSIGVKPIGAVVYGFNFWGCGKLFNEPGYILMCRSNEASNLVEMSWQSYAEGLLDDETVESELLFDVFETHKEEIARECNISLMRF